ncbi:MAG: ferrous iron transport protein A [Lentisphaerae bacterium]|nr:ferrous iron transport protein A [Lentisphaerota bacterium]
MDSLEKVSGASLAELPIGIKAEVTGISPQLRGRKKFADAGIVPGTRVTVEASAPFGGLIRVRMLDTSMALHRDDAAGIMIRELEVAHG